MQELQGSPVLNPSENDKRAKEMMKEILTSSKEYYKSFLSEKKR